LDLGERNSWYCVVDEIGQIRLEQRVRTNAKAVARSLRRDAARASQRKTLQRLRIASNFIG